MKQWIALIVAIAFFVAVGPVYAMDLTMPDALHGTSVAAIVDPGMAEVTAWEDSLVKKPELNERMAYERDKTNDTIAITAWVLLALLALTHQSRDGKDGADGNDGEPGSPGPPGPPGGCR